MEVHQLRFSLAVQNAPKPDRTWILDRLVRDCQFSADGRQIAAIEGKRKLSVWDIQKNRKVAELVPRGQILEAFAITHDHRRAVVVSFSVNAMQQDFTNRTYQLDVWDVASGDKLGAGVSIKSPKSLDFSNRISAEKGWVISRSESLTDVLIFDIRKGEVIKTVETGGPPVFDRRE